VTKGDHPFSVYAIQALGRMRSSAARINLRKLLRIRRPDHGETWLAAAAALARIPDPDGKTRELLQSLREMVGRLDEALDPPKATLVADSPDQPGDRALMLEETITLALARLGDEKSRERLVSWVDAGGGGGGGRFGQRSADAVLGRIEPFNQLLAIEAVAAMGDEGRKYLKKIVEESSDSLLRGYALAYLLRLGQDNKFAFDVAEDSDYPSVLRVQAMKGLATKETTRESALTVARAMVEDYVERPARRPGGRLAARAAAGTKFPSYECLASVKVLGEHDPLPARTLVKVLEVAKAKGDYERLVKARAGADGAGGRRAGPGMINTVTLTAFPALYETAVVELGRLGDVGSLGVLRGILEGNGGPGRPEAALGLGNLPVQEACDALISRLDDDEPWVRYSAYRALKKISGESFFADWLFGKAAATATAIESWTKWRRTRGADLPRVADVLEKQAATEKAEKTPAKKGFK
jgi:HEAT repeat protein